MGSAQMQHFPLGGQWNHGASPFAAAGAGGWSDAAAGLRRALKEAAGKLMGQLYDRNCRRRFAPTEAFQADALPQERFHIEMRVGGWAGL